MFKMKKAKLNLALLFLVLFLVLSSMSFIQANCCFDSINGICTDNTDEIQCITYSGTFNTGNCDSQTQCAKGCCVIGTDTKMATVKECELLSDTTGFNYPDNFKEITEAQCTELKNSQEFGACVIELEDSLSDCIFTTEIQCKGLFVKNYLCTAPELNTTCRKTTNTVLVSGKDEVYFTDSCGNTANIYDASKINDDAYWSRIFTKSESCSANDVNGNAASKTCGNCYYNKSSFGKIADSSTGTPNYGKYICVSLSCLTGEELDGYINNFDTRGWVFIPRKGTVTEWTQTKLNNPFPTPKKNGESWCYFDSPAPGTNGGATEDANVPGSRYYRRYCLNGKIITEPCGDKRTEYCNNGQCIKADYEACMVGTDESQCPLNNKKNMGCGFGTGPDSVFMRANENGGNAGKVYVFFGNYRDLYQQVNPPGFASTTAWGGEFHSPLLADLDLEHCYPWFSPGTTQYCSLGNQEVAVTFKKEGSEWAIYREDTGTGDCGGTWGRLEELTGMDMSEYCYNDLGNAGIFDLDPEAWTPNTYPDTSDFNYMDPAAVDALKIEQQGGSTGNTPATTLFLPLKNFAMKIFQPSIPYVSAWNWPVLHKVIDDWIGIDWDLGDGDSSQNMRCTDKNVLGAGCSAVQAIYDGGSGSLPVDGKVVKIMNNDCIWMGDCAGEPNYLGVGGSGGIISGMSCRKAGTDTVQCTFKFECTAWKAPASGECEKCGSDPGTTCSEYKCNSIGKNCVYHSASSGSGYCTSSNDKNSPIISITKYPTLPVEPYSAVEFNIRTNELAKCKFDINNQSTNYNQMRYSFSSTFLLDHKMVLYPPANPTQLDNSIKKYALINQGGNYTLAIKCEDTAGNFNTNPTLINFQVMQKPDTVTPRIINATPVSGSSIKFNTTEKISILTLNEPSECRWDFFDKQFDKMNNDMACQSSNPDSFLSGNYLCGALFTNITANISGETKFYVKCKDQPWLEGKEDNLYKRNVQTISYEYILRPSRELEIIDISPIGSFLLGKDDRIELKATTARGALAGRAKCYYKTQDINSSYTIFANTDSNNHRTILNISEGNYNFNIKCTDSAENNIQRNISFTYGIDRVGPKLIRFYETLGNIKIKTNEDSLCYYGLNTKSSCSMNFENLTQMSGSQKEHTASWSDKSTYYIKCKDYRGNANVGCTIIKTY